jgi:hypothetical protein
VPRLPYDYATCALPLFCSSGVSSCVNPDPLFNSQNGFTGHLQIRPKLVKKGDTARLYWNVANVLSCTVSGNNETKTGLSAGSSGTTTRAINSQVAYTLTCLTLPDGSSSVSETQTVNIIPETREI